MYKLSITIRKSFALLIVMLISISLVFSNNISNATVGSDNNSSITNSPDNSTSSAPFSTDVSSSDMNISNSTTESSDIMSFSDEMTGFGNITGSNFTQSTTINDTQLSGTEKIELYTNFSSKPQGLETDYQIVGKPLILIDNVPLNYEFINDTSDEITISDILVSMRATVKLDNSSSDAIPVYIKVFTNPANNTESANGSRTIMNDPSLVENIEIGGVIFSDAATTIKLYPNGTGWLRATN